MRSKISITIILLIVFIFSANISFGASYDIYVDKNYDGGDSDGSSEKPYTKISKAIEESSSKGKTIYIKNGTYTENLILENGIALYGQDRSKTIIENSGTGIIAKDKNEIKNLTIIGGSSAITFEGKGEISNCNIRKATKIAINLTVNSSAFKISNSKISENGKGIYIQKGRAIEINNNEFSNNKEEGIDVRSKVSGTIKNNKISNNGEGGIEVIIGSTDVSIISNSIIGNRASGIATQFYSDFDKNGNIFIKGNTINKNGLYGIICKSPSGGDVPVGYWNNSLNLSANKIENNKEGSIKNSCKISQLTEEEKQKEENDRLLKEAKTEEEKKVLAEKIEKELQIDNKINEIYIIQVSLNKTLLNSEKELIQSKKMINFLLTSDYTNIKNIISNIENLKQVKFQLEEANKELKKIESIDKIQKNSLVINQLSLQIEESEIFISNLISPSDKLLYYPLIDHYLFFPNSFQYN